MKELFIDKLVFRWNFLHLINRAHKDAKGKLSDVEHDDELSEYEDESDKEKEQKNENNTLITELIDYIQKNAKKLCHGIAFTQLKTITSCQLKRPKVWSSTRMVVYEFEIIERFLENSKCLAIKYMMLAKCKCLVMFALKIIFKKCAKNGQNIRIHQQCLS